MPRLVEIGLVVLERKVFKFPQCYFPILLSLLMEKGVALHLNTLEIPLSKRSLCQVWLKLAQWFWRTRKCEMFTTTTTTTDKGQISIRKDHLSLRPRQQQKQFMNIAGIPKLTYTMYTLLANYFGQDWVG